MKYVYLTINDYFASDGKFLYTVTGPVFSSLEKACNYMSDICKVNAGEIIENKHGIKLYNLLQYKTESGTIQIRLVQKTIN